MEERHLIVIAILAAITMVVCLIVGINRSVDMVDDTLPTMPKTTVYADDEFVESVEKAAEFVSEAIVDGHEYDILFCMETSDGRPIVIEQSRLAWNYGPEWRKQCKEAVYSELMNDQKIRELYDAGETVANLSTTISYMHGYCVASVCDTDNDGIADEKHVSSL